MLLCINDRQCRIYSYACKDSFIDLIIFTILDNIAMSDVYLLYQN